MCLCCCGRFVNAPRHAAEPLAVLSVLALVAPLRLSVLVVAAVCVCVGEGEPWGGLLMPWARGRAAALMQRRERGSTAARHLMQ